MSLNSRQFLTMVGAYVLLNGALAACALGLAGEVARQSAGLVPAVILTADAGPSRVEKFKSSERAALSAPQVPVPRIIVAREVPAMPVQALAIRLDTAEGVSAQPVPRKLKKLVRVAKAGMRTKPRIQPNGDLPDLVVLSEVAAVPVQKPKQRAGRLYALAESTRDITNRSLGVIAVGLK
jgi:hypothetical protein